MPCSYRSVRGVATHIAYFAIVFAISAAVAHPATGGAIDPPTMLWYAQPAKQWVEAMPIGNGRLGGMVFGDQASEHIQLNDDTIWAGGPRDRCNPKALEALPEVRRLLFGIVNSIYG